VLLGEGLRLLVAGLAGPLLILSVCTQRLTSASDVETTRLAGWRLPEAIWLADLSALGGDRTWLLLASGPCMADLIDDLLPGEPDADVALAAPDIASALREQLAALPARSSAPRARFCSKCGSAIEPGRKFCAKCKAPSQ